LGDDDADEAADGVGGVFAGDDEAGGGRHGEDVGYEEKVCYAVGDWWEGLVWRVAAGVRGSKIAVKEERGRKGHHVLCLYSRR